MTTDSTMTMRRAFEDIIARCDNPTGYRDDWHRIIRGIATEALAALTAEAAHVPEERPARESGRATVQYSPAECFVGCEDPQCPYMHMEAWSVGDKTFRTEAEAKAYAASSSSSGPCTGDDAREPRRNP